jgi:hypothetical protein
MPKISHSKNVLLEVNPRPSWRQGFIAFASKYPTAEDRTEHNVLSRDSSDLIREANLVLHGIERVICIGLG